MLLRPVFGPHRKAHRRIAEPQERFMIAPAPEPVGAAIDKYVEPAGDRRRDVVDRLRQHSAWPVILTAIGAPGELRAQILRRADTL